MFPDQDSNEVLLSFYCNAYTIQSVLIPFYAFTALLEQGSHSARKLNLQSIFSVLCKIFPESLFIHLQTIPEYLVTMRSFGF